MSVASSDSSGKSAVLAAARRIAGVRDSVGEEALRLAYHAALPVVVDAELLNLLRVNFFLDPPHALPYEVEADLLLSPLFREVGEDLFEIEPGLRNILLSGLQRLYGSARVQRVAELLELYTDATSAWPSQPELEAAQRLTAVSFLDPALAERWLEASETDESQSSSADSAPARAWYVAMRRHIEEHSAVTDVYREAVSAVNVLRNPDVQDRLEAIENLGVLSRLPETPVAYVVGALRELIQSGARSSEPPKPVTVDVQAALTLIGSLPHRGFQLDDVVLSGANLVGLNFAGVTFRGVTLSNVNAADANLTGATLSDVSMADTVLDRARLDGATLELDTLARGSYVGTSFVGATVTANRVQDVDLTQADVRGWSASLNTVEAHTGKDASSLSSAEPPPEHAGGRLAAEPGVYHPQAKESTTSLAEVRAESASVDAAGLLTEQVIARERKPTAPGHQRFAARLGPHIVLLGPPGAGKGTQAHFIASQLAIPRISTGDIFRYNVTHNTELGRKALEHMNRGDLTPDEVTVAMVKDRLAEDDAREAFVLDGFPRNVPQAETLKRMLATWDIRVNVALELVVDEDEVVRRLSGRRTCRRCERVWHVLYGPPSQPGICDDCGGELFQRDDDKEEVIRHRLEVYNTQTAPLIAFYADESILVGIDATGPVEEVTTRALAALRPLVL
jgi:adenylate kinase